jgi:CHAD domain-containing protein
MGEPKLDKWLTSLRPDDALGLAIARSIQSRIDAVCYFLPLAAEHADENVEYVHQLRVWARRTMAALDLYRPLLPKKQAKWLRKRIKQIREAAGNARDYDVLIQRYQAEFEATPSPRLLELLHRRRAESQEPIRLVCRRLKRGKKLRRRTEALLHSLGRTDSRKPAKYRFADWAHRPLQRLVDRFERTAPADPTDLAALHRFRIRGKQLRYGIELLAPAYPSTLKKAVYPELRRLQEQLGDVNDRAVAVRRLDQWISSEADPESRRRLTVLLQQEQEQRDAAIEEFGRRLSSGELQTFFEKIAASIARNCDH